ncbi:hypothetical protein J6590_080416 [Homalodisca vitripennis]|nr:hypothetical protein J6590_080416 [Homalodisca vitripennis]
MKINTTLVDWKTQRTSTLCSSHFQVLPRALVTWYINSSKDIHTVLVPFASSTEDAGHLVHKFVEGHPHCARPICKFYRGRWSLGTKICRSTSTFLVPFASSTEGAGHLVLKFVEGHPHCAVPFASSTEGAGHQKIYLHMIYPHCARSICKFYRGRWTSTLCSSHFQVLPRALVTWYINSSKDIHTVLVPFASSTEDAGHLVHKFVEGHPHCARPICKFYRGRWSLGTKICRSTSTFLVPFASSTEGAGHLVLKFVEGHPHCAVPFASSTEGAGHLVPKFVEGHPHCARPICKFYRGRWSLGT